MMSNPVGTNSRAISMVENTVETNSLDLTMVGKDSLAMVEDMVEDTDELV